MLTSFALVFETTEFQFKQVYSYKQLFLLITAWKVSVFGVILVRIFPHSDWIRRYSVSLLIQSRCERIRNKITPNTNTFYTVSTTLGNIKMRLCYPETHCKGQYTYDVHENFLIFKTLHPLSIYVQNFPPPWLWTSNFNPPME